MAETLRGIRFGPFWWTVRTRLDTPETQAVTGAPGRVYVVHTAPPPPPAGATGQKWGRVLVIPGRFGFPMTKSSSLLRRVYFRIVTQINNWATVDPRIAATYDPLIHLERLQAETKRLLDRWRAGVQPTLIVTPHVWLEEEYDPVPDWNAEQDVHELSSLYAFDAAEVLKP